MDKYINYTYYDDIGKRVAILNEGTPKEAIEHYKKLYDEISYEEKIYERKLTC